MKPTRNVERVINQREWKVCHFCSDIVEYIHTFTHWIRPNRRRLAPLQWTYKKILICNEMRKKKNWMLSISLKRSQKLFSDKSKPVPETCEKKPWIIYVDAPLIMSEDEEINLIAKVKLGSPKEKKGRRLGRSTCMKQHNSGVFFWLRETLLLRWSIRPRLPVQLTTNQSLFLQMRNKYLWAFS